jgi:GNAT superfamily N-acetyltransferase
MPTTIDLCGKRDLDKLVEISQACWTEPWNVGEFESIMASQRWKLFGLFNGDKVARLARNAEQLAYIAFFTDLDPVPNVFIASVATHPDYQLQGCARELVNNVQSLVRNGLYVDGRKVEHIATSIWPNYKPSRKLAERCGFMEVGRGLMRKSDKTEVLRFVWTIQDAIPD